MADETAETPAVHGWDAVADIMETFAAFFFIATLVSLPLLRLPVVWWIPLGWLLATAVLLIVAGRVRARTEARRHHEESRRRQAANRRDDQERKRRDGVRKTIAKTEVIVSPERIITLTELGAHAAVQAAVKDILAKYAREEDQFAVIPGEEFLAKMDRRAGRPRVDRDIDALLDALSEAPIEKTA
jgi:hypothetical protein